MNKLKKKIKIANKDGILIKELAEKNYKTTQIIKVTIFIRRKVNRQKKRIVGKRKVRDKKLPSNIREELYAKSEGKFTEIEEVSSRKLTILINQQNIQALNSSKCSCSKQYLSKKSLDLYKN